MDYHQLIVQRKQANAWCDAKEALGGEYMDYLLASVAKLYKGELRVRFAQWEECSILKPGLRNIAIPTGYGASSYTYFIFNPDRKQVDHEMLATDDHRDGWRYGHNSVFYVHTDDEGEIYAVTAPPHHRPSDLSLTDGALFLLNKSSEELSVFFPGAGEETLAYIH